MTSTETFQGEVVEYSGCAFYLDHPTNLNHMQGSFAFEVTIQWTESLPRDMFVSKTRTVTGTMSPGEIIRTVADVRRAVQSVAKWFKEAPSDATILMLNVEMNKLVDQL